MKKEGKGPGWMIVARLAILAAIIVVLQCAAPIAGAQSLDFEYYRTRVEPIFLKKRPSSRPLRRVPFDRGEHKRFSLATSSRRKNCLDRGPIAAQLRFRLATGNSRRPSIEPSPEAPAFTGCGR